MMKKFTKKFNSRILLVILMAFIFSGVKGQFSIASGSTDYTQNFNSLSSGAWNNNSTLPGWYARTTATASITAYGSNTGSTTTAGLYSYGVAGTNAATERALGYATSNGFTGAAGSGSNFLGWRLVNNTGGTITSVTVTYTGEQWRRDNTVAQSLNFSYRQASTVTDLTSGLWTSVSELTFNSPNNTGSASALDGNASANRTANISATISVSIASGEEIMLRWSDINDSGNDHQLTIDDVTVNATVESSGPSIFASASSLPTFGEVNVGSNSFNQTFTVSGSNLTDDVLVSAPTGFQVSLNGTSFEDDLFIDNQSGTLGGDVTVYVRFSPTAAGPFSGNITLLTDGDEKTVTVLGTGIVPTPELTVSTNTLPDFGDVTVGEESPSQSFTVSGSLLTANTLIVAPADFVLSTNDVTFSSFLNLGQTGGSINGQPVTIYVRFQPSFTGATGGDIEISSAGAATQIVSVSGTGVDPIIGAPIAIDATDVQTNSFIANWEEVSGAASYRLDVSTSPTFSSLTTGSATTEVFTGIGGGTSTSYLTRSWTGVDGISWTAFKSRTDQVVFAGNSAITLQNAADSYLISGTISGGLTALSFDVLRTFTGADGILTIRVFHGAGFATETNLGTIGYNATVQTFSNNSLNITGDFVIRIDNNAAARPAIDNLSFTRNLTETPSFVAGYEDLTVNGLTQTVSGLSANTEYHYRVRAFDGTTSENSNVISVVTLPETDPVIIPSVTSLPDFGSIIVGNDSTSQSFTVTAENVTEGVLVSASTDFSVSLNDVTFSSTVELTQTAGELDGEPVTVYVRFSPTATGLNNGTITLTSAGAEDKTVSVLGTGYVPTPELTASVNSLPDFGNVIIGEESTSQSFTVSGSFLTSNTLIFAPEDFVLSTDNSNFSSFLNLGQTGGSLTGQPVTVYVRFQPSFAGTTSGDVEISSTGAITQIVSVSGTGVNPIIDAPVATSASSVGSTSFVANWDAVEGAISYQLDVYSIQEGSPATDLFISEYGEGAPGNRKYVEIFNGTGADVNLSQYELIRATNGAGWPTTGTAILALSGTLANGETLVVANNSSDVTGADIYNAGFAGWNGNDAVGLFKNDVLIDVFGTPDSNPGTGWSVAGTNNATVDRILVRKSTVSAGNINWSVSAGTSTEDSEWIISRVWSAVDPSTPVTLGSHSFDGNGNNTVYVPGYQNLSVNGTSQLVTGLDAATTYFYVVRAVDEVSTSQNSNEISVTTAAPILTQIRPYFCGTTLQNVNSSILADVPTGLPSGAAVTGYRYEITNLSTNDVREVEKTIAMIRITDSDIAGFGTAYSIRVAVRINQEWQDYGTGCSLFTPAIPTTTVSTLCGQILPSIQSTIFATPVTSALGYEFEVSRIEGGIAVQTTTIERAVNNFKITLLSGIDYVYSTDYQVRVRVKAEVNGVEAWSGYGAVCSVFTPEAPEAAIEGCGGEAGITPAALSTPIYATPITGATLYRFTLTDDNSYSQVYTTPSRFFRLSNFNALSPLTPGGNYSVTVETEIYGNFYAGKDCNILVPGGMLIRPIAVVKEVEPIKGVPTEFNVIAYPNPFATSFAIDVRTSNTEKVSLTVYDMAGRLLEVKELNASEVANYQFGDRFPSGVYNMVVTQGEETKTVRVVKQ